MLVLSNFPPFRLAPEELGPVISSSVTGGGHCEGDLSEDLAPTDLAEPELVKHPQTLGVFHLDLGLEGADVQALDAISKKEIGK